MLFSFGVRPLSNVRPSIRVALQAFAFCRGQPAHDPLYRLFYHRCVVSFRVQCARFFNFKSGSSRLRTRFIRKSCTVVRFALIFQCHSLRVMHRGQRAGYFCTCNCICLPVSNAIACRQNCGVVGHSAFVISGNCRDCFPVTIAPCIKDFICHSRAVNSVQCVALVFLYARTICAGRFGTVNNVSCQAINRLEKGLIL